MFQVQGKSDVWNFLALCSNLSLLPLRIQTRDSFREVNQEIPTGQKWITGSLYTMTVVHSLFKSLRLIQAAFMWENLTQLYQVILHFEIATACAVFSFWMIILYVGHPGAHATLINITLNEDDGGSGNAI